MLILSKNVFKLYRDHSFPLLSTLGPVLTGFLEIFFQLKRCLSRPPHPPVPRRRGLWIFLILVSASIFCSYTTNLILAAAFLPTYFKVTPA